MACFNCQVQKIKCCTSCGRCDDCPGEYGNTNSLADDDYPT